MATSTLLNNQERCINLFRRPPIHSASDTQDIPAIPHDPLDSMRGLLYCLPAGLLMWAAPIYLLIRK